MHHSWKIGEIRKIKKIGKYKTHPPLLAHLTGAWEREGALQLRQPWHKRVQLKIFIGKQAITMHQPQTQSQVAMDTLPF
jgi:hypothetical protein